MTDLFHGTLPPPPWPAGPTLVKARTEMEQLRDGFEVLARKSPQLRWPLKIGKVGPRLQALGGKLFDEVAALQGRAAASKSLADLIPSPKAALQGIGLVVAVLLFLHFFGDGSGT